MRGCVTSTKTRPKTFRSSRNQSHGHSCYHWSRRGLFGCTKKSIHLLKHLKRWIREVLRSIGNKGNIGDSVRKHHDGLFYTYYLWPQQLLVGSSQKRFFEWQGVFSPKGLSLRGVTLDHMMKQSVCSILVENLGRVGDGRLRHFSTSHELVAGPQLSPNSEESH